MTRNCPKNYYADLGKCEKFREVSHKADISDEQWSSFKCDVHLTSKAILVKMFQLSGIRGGHKVW